MQTGTHKQQHGARHGKTKTAGTVETRSFDAAAGTVLTAAMTASAARSTHQFGTAQLDR